MSYSTQIPEIYRNKRFLNKFCYSFIVIAYSSVNNIIVQFEDGREKVATHYEITKSGLIF